MSTFNGLDLLMLVIGFGFGLIYSYVNKKDKE